MPPKLRCTLLLATTLLGGLTMAEASPAGRLGVTPASGAAPLTVVFSGGAGSISFFGGVMIEFGDGSRARFCEPGQPCEHATIEHSYKQRGEFVAKLVGRGEGSPRVLATVTVKVD